MSYDDWKLATPPEYDYEEDDYYPDEYEDYDIDEDGLYGDLDEEDE